MFIHIIIGLLKNIFQQNRHSSLLKEDAIFQTHTFSSFFF